MLELSQDQLSLVHLTASPFLGGPERQMLGLAKSLQSTVKTTFWSFAEGGKSQPFLDAARQLGFDAESLERNVPDYRGAISELTQKIAEVKPDILFCHGYKADLLGGLAARRLKIRVVAVSRGWTGATWKVRVNEILDRLALVGMDQVVCVSNGQAEKVKRAGVPSRRVRVIRNAIFSNRFDNADPNGKNALLDLFPTAPKIIVGAAGRLSPEKGFDVLIGAAARVVQAEPSAGFVVFGEGPLRGALERRIASEGLEKRFILAPFRSDLDRVIPHLDLMVLPSYTEGLPNVALEASAASVPLVATEVGGTPEVVEDGVTGYLVPPGDPLALAARITELLHNPQLRYQMGVQGRRRIKELFTFESQAESYLELCRQLVRRKATGIPEPVRA